MIIELLEKLSNKPEIFERNDKSYSG